MQMNTDVIDVKKTILTQRTVTTMSTFSWKEEGTEQPFGLFSFLFFLSFFLGGAHLQHMEVHRLGVELELQKPACATAQGILDP